MSEVKYVDGNQEPGPNKGADGQNTLLYEGIDYYLENGLMVFTAEFLSRRGYCCERGCRHCPYGYSNQQQEK